SVGLSIIWVEFERGTDIYRDRQIVGEKLQQARERLKISGEEINPTLAPISSIMGEIMLLGLRPVEAVRPARPGSPAAANKAIDVRDLGELTLRNRLLAVEGVAQVSVMGGTLKQYQIITSPHRLAAQNVALDQLVEAAEKANVIAAGGIVERGSQEYQF